MGPGQAVYPPERVRPASARKKNGDNDELPRLQAVEHFAAGRRHARWRARAARRATSSVDQHSRVGLHHVQWHILIAEKVATLISGRVIGFGHGPFRRRRSSLRPPLGWWYSQRRTRLQVFALAEAPRWTNTKSVSCWSRSRQAASPVARSCRRWLG